MDEGDEELDQPGDSSEGFGLHNILELIRREEQQAAQQAVRCVQESWLPLLENFLANADDFLTKIIIDAEIQRLRRTLGVRYECQLTELEIKERRAKTLVRVRGRREKKRATALDCRGPVTGTN